MAVGTRHRLDARGLAQAVVEKAAAQGKSQRQACREMGLQPNVLQKLQNLDGYAPDSDVLLSILVWLGQGYTRFASVRDAG